MNDLAKRLTVNLPMVPMVEATPIATLYRKALYRLGKNLTLYRLYRSQLHLEKMSRLVRFRHFLIPRAHLKLARLTLCHYLNPSKETKQQIMDLNSAIADVQSASAAYAEDSKKVEASTLVVTTKTQELSDATAVHESALTVLNDGAKAFNAALDNLSAVITTSKLPVIGAGPGPVA